MNQDILVLGGSGKTGRRVAERLRARELPVRIGSRLGEPPFDWEDRSTWAPALRGTAAAYVSFYPDLAVPGAPEAIGALAEPIAAGELALPAGDVPAPFVDAEDIADVAVAALTEDGHAGRVYELTGPRALTHAEVVEEIGRATGRQIAYVPIPPEAFAAALAEDGVPPDVVSLLRYLFAEVLVEGNAGVAGGVREALGREPRDFAGFARTAAREGAWDRSLAEELR